MTISPSRKATADFKKIWNTAIPANNAPQVRKYLRQRGLQPVHSKILKGIRFLANAPYPNSERHLPGIIVPLRPYEGELSGVYIIYLTEDSRQRANVFPNEAVFGEADGAAFWMDPIPDDEPMIFAAVRTMHINVNERLEDAIMMKQQYCSFYTCCCFGASIAAFNPPSNASDITIYTRGDMVNDANRKILTERLLAAGYSVEFNKFRTELEMLGDDLVEELT